jgi:hypothetical protein
MARSTRGKRVIDCQAQFLALTTGEVSSFREFAEDGRGFRSSRRAKVKSKKILLVLALCAYAATAVVAYPSPTIPVNCTLGQSLNATLSKLPKQVPITALGKGTCTEYVTINGFTDLTLVGLPGATLQQPSTTPGGGVPIYVVLIEASRSITIDGFAIHSNPSALGAIAIGRNSIRL